MANSIVFLNVSQTQAPTPPTLQQTGAFISQGGTTGAAASFTQITQMSDLTAILATPLALTSMAWASGVVTATATAPHGLTNGSVYQLTIAGAVPAGYNGTYACTVTSTTAFTFAVTSNPGTATTPGTWVSGSRTELSAMATTFFAQGFAVAPYIIELGNQTTAGGIAALTTWLINNPSVVYAIVVPRAWDAAAALLTLLASYEATTSQLYFFITTTNATYTNYTALMKCAYCKIEPPTINLAAEFQIASDFYQIIQQKPSSTNKVAPLAFRYVFGVTPYPVPGNQTLFAAWKAAGVNWTGTGYQGGISTAIIFWGKTMDGRPFNYWYDVDWLEINITLNMTNAVINGSNNPINPLYLNQDGIHRLQVVGANTLTSATTFGMLTGTVVQTELDGPTFNNALNASTFKGQSVINSVPYVPYFAASPSDYRTGTYNGFSITCTPLRGFESITININVTDFVS